MPEDAAAQPDDVFTEDDRFRSDVRRRGGAVVGFLSHLNPVEAGVVRQFRQWHEEPHPHIALQAEFVASLGPNAGLSAFEVLDELCVLCRAHGRRPIMRHAVGCRCLGADEACFAQFVVTAAEGAQEDAMLVATLLVRPDMAGPCAALAQTYGLSLRRMALRTPEAANRTGSDRLQ